MPNHVQARAELAVQLAWSHRLRHEPLAAITDRVIREKLRRDPRDVPAHEYVTPPAHEQCDLMDRWR